MKRNKLQFPTIKCPICKGEGKVDVEFRGYIQTESCPGCHETGRMSLLRFFGWEFWSKAVLVLLAAWAVIMFCVECE